MLLLVVFASAINLLKDTLIVVVAESSITSVNSSGIDPHTGNRRKPTSKPAYRYPTAKPVKKMPPIKPVKNIPTRKPIEKIHTNKPLYKYPSRNPTNTYLSSMPSYRYPTNKPFLASNNSSIEPTIKPTHSAQLQAANPTIEPTFSPSFVPTYEPSFVPSNIPSFQPTFCIIPCIKDRTCGCEKYLASAPGYGPDIILCYNATNLAEFFGVYNASQFPLQGNLILLNPNFPNTSTFPGDAATCAGKQYDNKNPFLYNKGTAYKVGGEYYLMTETVASGTLTNILSCTTGNTSHPVYMGGISDCAGNAGSADVGTVQLEPHSDLTKDSQITIIVISSVVFTLLLAVAMFMLYRRYKNNNMKEKKVFGLENFYPHSLDHMGPESERNSYTNNTNSEMSRTSVENDVSDKMKAFFETINPDPAVFDDNRHLTTSSF